MATLITSIVMTVLLVAAAVGCANHTKRRLRTAAVQAAGHEAAEHEAAEHEGVTRT